MKKFFNLKALGYAISHPNNRETFKLLLTLGIVTFLLATFLVGWGIFSVSIIVGLLGFASILLYFAQQEWHSADGINKYAMLRNWVDAANTASERERRMGLLMGRPLDDAFALSGLNYIAPQVNVDGTMMLMGGVVDIRGNPFGTLSTFQYNIDSNTFSNPYNDYQAPVDMDKQDF